jgi:signal transduction histidine kinase
MPFDSIEDPVTLRRLLDATLLIEADLDLPVLLRHVVEEACSMTNARYGALGVLTADQMELSEFITVGLELDEVAQIGPLPTGKGLLGALIAKPVPLRLQQIGTHADSYGFPPGHPPMTSFLGVPISVHDEVFGNLYLTDKLGRSEFTSDDESLVKALAIAAGIAIENARLHHRLQDLAVSDDRERVARDLHDTVIQTLFGAGLSIQAIAGAAEAADVSDQLAAVGSTIDHAISQLRSTIYELGLNGGELGIRAKVISLLRELTVITGFEVHSSFYGPVDSAISDAIAEHLLATLREAVTNVGRHARATQASVRISVASDECLLQVTDNGRGFGPGEDKKGGLGLNNMRHRAEKLNGRFDVESQSGGTVLTWCVPL